MKLPINLDEAVLPLRLIVGVEYILTGSSPIIFSTSETQIILYHKCIGNGTTEVYFVPDKTMSSDDVWLFYGSTTKVAFDTNEFVLADHQPDFTPDFYEEEYPLFVKLLEYYLRYIGLPDQPSGFIHNLEKFAHIDETFDEFLTYIYDEVLHYFPETVADRKILAKYIIDFYLARGSEDSIAFLIYVLTGQEALITKGRNSVLIASDKVQGRLSDSGIVLNDNYFNSLFAYAIYLKGVSFGKYKDVLYKLVNPDGYLPFGVNLHDAVEVTVQNTSATIEPVA